MDRRFRSALRTQPMAIQVGHLPGAAPPSRPRRKRNGLLRPARPTLKHALWTAPAERGTVVPRGDGTLVLSQVQVRGSLVAESPLIQRGLAHGTDDPRLRPHSKWEFPRKIYRCHLEKSLLEASTNQRPSPLSLTSAYRPPDIHKKGKPVPVGQSDPEPDDR